MTPTCVHCGGRDATHRDDEGLQACGNCDAEVAEPALEQMYVMPLDRSASARAVHAARTYPGRTVTEIAEDIGENGDTVSAALYRAVKAGYVSRIDNGSVYGAFGPGPVSWCLSVHLNKRRKECAA